MKSRVQIAIVVCFGLISLWLIKTQLGIVKRDNEIRSKLEATEHHQKRLEDLKANAEYKTLKLNSSVKFSNSLEEVSQRLTKSLKEAKQHVGGKILSLDSSKHQLEDIQKTSRELSKAEDEIARIKKLQSDKMELEQLIAELTAQKEQLLQTQQKQKSLTYKAATSPKRLKTSVLHAFGSYGFVSIEGGENLGIKKYSVLNISRKQRVIAKALVSHVNPKVSIANIIPDSVTPSTLIKSGDIVTSSR